MRGEIEKYCDDCEKVVTLTEDGYCPHCGVHAENMLTKSDGRAIGIRIAMLRTRGRRKRLVNAPSIDEVADKHAADVIAEFVRRLYKNLEPWRLSKATVMAGIERTAKEMSQPSETPWIPVEERLPDRDGGYLITDKEGFMLVSYWQTKQQRFLVIQDGMAAEPIAWMPLPQPYKPSETQDTDTAPNADADVCECGHPRNAHYDERGRCNDPIHRPSGWVDACKCTGYKRKGVSR